MDFDAVYERTTREQAYLGVIAGIALGTARAVHLDETSALSLPAFAELRESMQRLLAVGERSVEAWTEYLRLGDAGGSHKPHCLRGNIGGLKVILSHLGDLAALHERFAKIRELWPDSFGDRLHEIIDEFHEIGETLALGLDEDFCAEVERRIDEAKAESSPRGTPGTGTARTD